MATAYAAVLVVCFGVGTALADPPAGTESGAGAATSDAQKSVPSGGFFSSLKQALNHDFEHDVVRGHFDVGSPPDSHRYYCLVDAKTGKREPNGVAGEPVLRPDGMTGIKSGAVSFHGCAEAELQGALVTAGYVLSPGAEAAVAPAPPAPLKVDPTARQVEGSAPGSGSADKIDIAGVRLGMTPEQVRAVLKSRKLLDFYESAQTLSGSDSSKGRFVNVIAAWTAIGEEGESYQVMFTPVPGKERAMAIIHSTAYSSANAVREVAVENALATKYGGYSGASDMPGSPTWRLQSTGNMLVGDACNRRGIFGGLAELTVGTAARQNLALNTTPAEFRFQIDRCGVAIVTEDHAAPNGEAPGPERIITRLTVTAYSPSIGLDGATAATQLIQAGDGVDKTKAPRAKDQPAPNL